METLLQTKKRKAGCDSNLLRVLASQLSWHAHLPRPFLRIVVYNFLL